MPQDRQPKQRNLRNISDLEILVAIRYLDPELRNVASQFEAIFGLVTIVCFIFVVCIVLYLHVH
jgi:hypothetical protein